MSRSSFWRWQRRFAEKRVDVLLREYSRRLGNAPVLQETMRRVITRDRRERRHTGLGRPDSQDRWPEPAPDLARMGNAPAPNSPHSYLQVFLNLAFAAKVENVVGLYMNPPAHAVVLSIEEKS